MSKYDKMLEVNHKQSVEKIQRAKLTIQEMIEEEDKVTVPKLMQKTGLSRGFFYKNPEVRKEVPGHTSAKGSRSCLATTGWHGR